MAGGVGKMSYAMVGMAVVSLVISFIASIVASNCTKDGDGKCGTTASVVMSVAGLFAALGIGVSMFNSRQRMMT